MIAPSPPLAIRQELFCEKIAAGASLVQIYSGFIYKGPALIREANATTVVEPGWQAEVTALNHMILRRVEARANAVVADTGRPDPVMLELFGALFMSIAEQTGTVLQNTSLSVNIKERLDFSCAIFDAEGRLVANAPHVPVHLGAMGESVRTVIRSRGATLRPGDVVAAAHARIRETIPFLDRDRALDGEVAAAVRLVSEGALLSVLPRWHAGEVVPDA